MSASVPTLQGCITDEIFRALNLPQGGALRLRLGPLFGAPARRFAARPRPSLLLCWHQTRGWPFLVPAMG